MSRNSKKGQDSDDTKFLEVPRSCVEIRQNEAYSVSKETSDHMRLLLNFMNSDPNNINGHNNPTTNIVNLFEKKCYHFPDDEIKKFMRLLENCRRNNDTYSIYEKQGEVSGIMLDFDILQDEEESLLTQDLFFSLLQRIFTAYSNVLDFSECPLDTHVCITKRPVIKTETKYGCFKDGIHVLIPGVKVSKPVKKFLIDYIAERDIMTKVFRDVPPTTKLDNYNQEDYLDRHSCSVPVFFIGASTKPKNLPYEIHSVYRVSWRPNDIALTIIPETDKFRSKGVNFVYEFSMNWGGSPGHLVKSHEYNVKTQFIREIGKTRDSDREIEIRRMHGELSTASIHDSQVPEIREMLNALSPDRADDRHKWLGVMFALANTSPSYKELAREFSMRSSKYDPMKFDQEWEDVCNPRTDRKRITIGSLMYWAKQDNPSRFEEIRKRSAQDFLNSMIYDSIFRGVIAHGGVAKLLKRLVGAKYKTDIPEGATKLVWYEFIVKGDDQREGEIYKWRSYEDQKEKPSSLTNYIMSVLPKLYEFVLDRLTIKESEAKTQEETAYYKLLIKNFRKSTAKLQDKPYIEGCIALSVAVFQEIGFARSLDKDPLVRGVRNGVLKLSVEPGIGPKLIQGYHNYKVTKFTESKYIPFNPYDEKTKKIILALRQIFPDDEPDTHEFVMNYLASTIDSKTKESMFMMMVGRGSNGKSFLNQLHKSAIGDEYGVKLPLDFLTQKNKNANSATPTVMKLKDASFAFFSESSEGDVLNSATIKELTGMESISARPLYGKTVNFRPTCYYLITTNHDFTIRDESDGLWRRLLYVFIKTQFIDTSRGELDPDDPYQRPADHSMASKWSEDPEIQGRYLGYIVWLHYWLNVEHQGLVSRIPHPHIKYNTQKYRKRQDAISAFISKSLIRCADYDEKEPTEYLVAEEIRSFEQWHEKNIGGGISNAGLLNKFLNNSKLAKFIVRRKHGEVLRGYRFLRPGQKLDEGEKYVYEDFDIKAPKNNFGIKPETPQEYYEKVCKKFDEFRHLFEDNGEFDITGSEERKLFANQIVPEREENFVVIEGVKYPAGVEAEALKEANIVTKKSKTTKAFRKLKRALANIPEKVEPAQQVKKAKQAEQAEQEDEEDEVEDEDHKDSDEEDDDSDSASGESDESDESDEESGQKNNIVISDSDGDSDEDSDESD
jgi:hypothetical protein